MKLKKLAVMALAAVMTAAMLLIPASAESIANTAKSRKSGESFSIKLNDASNHDYKVKLTKGGDLKISLTAAVADIEVYLFDTDGNKLLASEKSSSATSGSIYVSSYSSKAECKWNSTMEKFKGTVVYKELDKGTYYIRINKYSSYTSYSGQGKTTVKFTFPGETAEESESSETKASPSLTVTVKA
ncbi:MAG: PPC domain-containing protein, partial [Ruminiclostridium sp.]|nr:PPC domain-containing protein [Ruminiclostridium sp.]